MNTKKTIVMVLVMALLLSAVGVAGAVTVKVDPTTQNVQAGDSFNVDIIIDDVTNMGAGQATLNFDSTAMEATKIVEGNFLKSAGRTIGIELLNRPGKAIAAYALCSYGVAVTGSGKFVTVSFKTDKTATGSYPLDLTDVMLLTGKGERINVDAIEGGTITISTIPEAVEGDINGDGVVNYTDYWLLRRAYGSRPGSYNWNANADLNHDGIVNWKDMRILFRAL